MNIQDEIDRLQTAARVANERTREWQAVADRQRGEIEGLKREREAEHQAALIYFAALMDLEIGAEQRSQSHVDVLVRIHAAYAAAKESTRALRAALRAGEGVL